MNPDLWWNLYRSLNRAGYSYYSNKLRSTQATIWTHTSSWLTWTMHQPPRGLCLCPSPPKGHSPHYSCKDPASKWSIVHGSSDQSLSDPLAFWESNSDSYSSTSLFMTCRQGLCLMPSTPLPLNHSGPECCFSSVQFSSVTQSCPTLCDPMNRSMPGLPVHHQLPEFTQTHVHHQALFWRSLLKTSLSQGISLTLTSLLYPHHFLSSEQSS